MRLFHKDIQCLFLRMKGDGVQANERKKRFRENV